MWVAILSASGIPNVREDERPLGVAMAGRAVHDPYRD
jgi:hypothetical protein